MSNSENNPLESIAENIATITTGIPAPIRKNFFKACNQLCTALIDIPVSWLEDKARINRAITDSREALINKMGENMSANIDVPEIYSYKATEKLASKIIKQQINLDKIVQNTALNLKSVDSTPVEAEEISDDWLNAFEEIAKLKSSEEMQLVFARILANEISNPGAFSLKTLNIVAQLDSIVASKFIKFSSCCLHFKTKEAILTSIFPAIFEEHLEKANISYYDITLLKDYGLLHSSQVSYNLSNIVNLEGAFLGVGDKVFTLISSDTEEQMKTKKINIQGYNLTTAGLELINSLSLEKTNEIISSEIENLIKIKNLEMKEV